MEKSFGKTEAQISLNTAQIYILTHSA